MKMRTLACAAAVLAIASCGGSETAKDAPKAPENPPMKLDPNPPMSAQDIDAIVNQTRGSPAASGQQGEGK